MKQYDFVVIGGGPGGYEAALEAARLGLKTVLIEKDQLGGTCLNRGCIPTKTLLHASELYGEMKAGSRFGVWANQVFYDMEKIQAHKEETLKTLREGIAALLKKAKVEVYHGTGRIVGEHQVEVGLEKGTEVLEAAYILLATGSVPSVPPIPGADLFGVMTSDELLDYRGEAFPTLVIIGGGVIGMEFASVYQAFGSHVVVLEALDRILPNMDKEIGQSLKMLMKKRGVDIHNKAMVREITAGENGKLICAYEEKGERIFQEADGILIAAGRRPYTQGLFGPGMEPVMDRGRIVVDKNFQTSIPSVFAIGDVSGRIQLAHAATAQGQAAARLCAGKEAGINRDLIPSCVYTSPEIACIGLSLEEAKERGISAESKKYPMSANGKSVLTLQERGFIKVVYEKESGRILGAQMMCARATDMISEFGCAIKAGMTRADMASVIRPHPTFSEGISGAVKE